MRLFEKFLFYFFMMLITSTFLYYCRNMLHLSNDLPDTMALLDKGLISTLTRFSLSLGSCNSHKSNSYWGKMNEIRENQQMRQRNWKMVSVMAYPCQWGRCWVGMKVVCLVTCCWNPEGQIQRPGKNLAAAQKPKSPGLGPYERAMSWQCFQSWMHSH